MKDKKNTPQVLARRALLVLLDAAIVAFSFYFALLLRADGAVEAAWWPHNRELLYENLPWIVAVYIASFLFSGLYSVLWKYAGERDLMRLAGTVAVPTVVVYCVNRLCIHGVLFNSANCMAAVLIFLLVGGSPRMPAVERQVRELLGCEPSHTLNPDECVAMGAAVQGGLLQGGGKLAGATGAAAQGLVLMDVTPLTLSIETLGGVATPLITRNSMIPTRKSQIFTTARPMQTSVEINVLQGERHFARDNKSLGKFKLTGIRSGFSSKPQIEVTFDIDVNGVVKVSAKDLGTGREQNITITGSTNLSENEIQRAMADAAAYEEEDTRRRERLELHNQAEMLAYKVDEALSKCKKELDKDEKNRVKNDLASLRRCLRKDKPEKMNETEEANLRQAKSQLEASANHLMVLYSTEQDAGQQ